MQPGHVPPVRPRLGRGALDLVITVRERHASRVQYTGVRPELVALQAAGYQSVPVRGNQLGPAGYHGAAVDLEPGLAVVAEQHDALTEITHVGVHVEGPVTRSSPEA